MELMYSEETGSIEIENGDFSLLVRAEDVVTVEKKTGSIKLTFRNGETWAADCSKKDMNMIFDTLRDMIDPVDEECEDDDEEDCGCCGGFRRTATRGGSSRPGRNHRRPRRVDAGVGPEPSRA